MSSAGGAGAARKVLKGKPKPLYFWTSADVNKWWRKHGGLCYQLYGDLLTEHDVGGGYMAVYGYATYQLYGDLLTEQYVGGGYMAVSAASC